jgi:hypothetical protein
MPEKQYGPAVSRRTVLFRNAMVLEYKTHPDAVPDVRTKAESAVAIVFIGKYGAVWKCSNGFDLGVRAIGKLHAKFVAYKQVLRHIEIEAAYCA